MRRQRGRKVERLNDDDDDEDGGRSSDLTMTTKELVEGLVT
jgi:hypothetical protein